MPQLDLSARRKLFEVPRGGRRVLIDTDADAVQVVSELHRELALKTPFRAHPAPVETCVHEDASGARVLFVIQPGKEPVEARIEVPAATAFEDVMSGERFAGTREVSVPMKGMSCRMLSVAGAAGEDAGASSAVAS